ncbi:MAG: divalent-cation tolerance protein CutA [Clostridium sp.]|nr:divalent-cation tolerance protein CutA [Clostridium sp.]
MSNFEEFLIEFEKYLEKKYWEFKKYEIEDSFLYDIEETVVVLIEGKEEFSKEHIICRELLNLKNEKDYNYSDIKIKPFCSKYIKEWVTFYPFKGEITEKLKSIDKKQSSLKLLERYKKWKGYRVVIAGFELEDNNEKGYALVKVPSIGGVVELREIAKYLLNAYIDFTIENPLANIENERVIKITNTFEFMIDTTMAKILNERYIKKYSIDSLRKAKEIVDLKGFWTSVYLKDKKEIPYDLFNNLENGKTENIGIIYDIYTDNMKSRITKIEDFDKEYYYVSVVYADDLDSYDFYNYLSDDKSVKTGDKVLVNRAGDDVIALVTEAKYYLGSEVPFPVSRTKSIIKKIENDEELQKYGYKSEDFADYEFYNDENDDDDESEYYHYFYYIVTTLCDKQEIADRISKTLMEKKLVAGSQISKVKSDYWWGGKIETKEEFKLEFRTRSDKINEIVEVIKSIHDYQIPAISKTEIKCLTEEMEKWIDESVE